MDNVKIYRTIIGELIVGEKKGRKIHNVCIIKMVPTEIDGVKGIQPTVIPYFTPFSDSRPIFDIENTIASAKPNGDLIQAYIKTITGIDTPTINETSIITKG